MMKAMILEACGPIEQRPLQFRDVPRPRPGRGQVLLKVGACGVCRSNLHMIEGDWPGVPTKFPIIPGHEVVGRIEELGEGVDWLPVGARAGVQPLFSTCGHCEFCLSGRDQLCQSKEITGETIDGGFAEYMVADARHTHLVPDSLSDVAAASLFCPGITAFGSVAKAGLTPSKTAAVFGVGGVGHVVLQMALLHGGSVTAVARSAAHQAVAEELGATHVIDASREDPGEVLARTGGVDATFVFAPSNELVRQAIQATKPGGIIITGVNVDLGRFAFATEKTVVGSLLGNRQQMREVLDLAAAGKIHVVHEQQPLEAANETLARLKRGEIRARAILVP
jgi:alcohol dehydrogenase, propanol-preferring